MAGKKRKPAHHRFDERLHTPLPAPSLYRRYVARARTLKEDARFNADIAAERTRWNDRWSEFAVSGRGYPPETSPSSLAGIPAIVAAMNARPLDEQRMERAAKANLDWQNLKVDVCRRWWPERFYPVWQDAYIHPAAPFVHACLMWGPTLVPEEWIETFRPVMMSAHVPALARGMSPDAVRWHSVYLSLMRQIDDMLARGETISREDLRRLDRAAVIAALQNNEGRGNGYEGAGDAAYIPTNEMPVVPLYPGMTSTDWRGMEAHVLATLEACYPFEDDIRKLHEHGESIYAIARLVGYSESQVREIVRQG